MSAIIKYLVVSALIISMPIGIALQKGFVTRHGWDIRIDTGEEYVLLQWGEHFIYHVHAEFPIIAFVVLMIIAMACLAGLIWIVSFGITKLGQAITRQ